MIRKAISQKIVVQLQKSESVLVITHRHPDGDAIGSMTALTHWLNALGKHYECFCREVPPSTNQMSFLIDPTTLITDPAIITEHRYDTVVIVDCGDTKIGGVDDTFDLLKSRSIVINIDHHATNIGYGHINVVETSAASTTEILYQLFVDADAIITPAIATALLTGIIFDTYNFTNPNVSQQTMHVASQLLAAGASLNLVSDAMLKTKSIPTIQCWGTILTRLTRHPEYNIATTVIDTSDVSDAVPIQEISEGAANFLNNLGGVSAVLLLRQDADGYIKGSLRTASNDVDVSALAKLCGGGGHRKAAGFRMKGQLVKMPEGYWQIV
jgi:phosphoesterase RecJ-like protein